MLISDQFGIIQNLQTSPIPKTSFVIRAFFCHFLQLSGSSSASCKADINSKALNLSLKVSSGTGNHAYNTHYYKYILRGL